jgi:hypothetical protein
MEAPINNNQKWVNEKVAFELKNNIKSAEKHLNPSNSQSKIQSALHKYNIIINNELKLKEKVLELRNS